MPVNGRIDYGTIEYRLDLDCTGVIGTGVGGVGRLTTRYTPDQVVTALGIMLWTRSTNGGLYGTQADLTLDIPAGGVARAHTIAGFQPSVSSVAEIDFTVYMTGSSVWRVDIAAVRWRVNGSVIWTGGGWSYLSGMVPSPSALGPFGYAPAIEAAGVRDLTWGGVYGGGGSTVLLGACIATGGYRTKLNGESEFTAHPVRLEVLEAPGSVALPEVSGSDTWSMSAQGVSSLVMGGVLRQGARTSTVWAWPELERGLVRMAPGYASRIRRRGYPQARARGEANAYSIYPSPPAEIPDPVQVTQAILPRLTTTTGIVRDGSHPMESVFSQDLRCPYVVSTYETVHSATDVIELYRASVYPLDVETLAVNPSIPVEMDHPDALTRLWNTWWHPHLAFGHKCVGYEVDGSFLAETEYESVVGEQWFEGVDLPVTDRTRQRNTILASPLWASEMALLPGTLAGESGFYWPGVTRFQIDAVEVPSIVAMTSASSAAWSATGGTLAHGADVTVTSTAGGTGPSTVTIDIDLGRWTESPYMAAEISREIEIPAASGNVSAIRAYVVGVDGTARLLGGPGWVVKNAGSSSRFAGSWAIDNGAGVVTDTGSDVGASGISAATMASPERLATFDLLPGYAESALRLEVDLTDSSLPGIIAYPRFRRSPERAYLVPEHRQVSVLLWPTSPLWRWGNWQWYDPVLGLQTVPIVRGLDYLPTIIDALCSRRAVVQGVDRLTGGSPDLTTQLTELFDTFEGQSVGQADRSMAFLLPPGGSGNWIRWALVNWWSEYPPLALLPRRRRNADDWLETGAYGCWMYDRTHLDRYVIGPSPWEPQLRSPAGVAEGGPVSGVPTGWSVWRAAPVVDNTESGWQISAGGEHIGTVRPWHGFSFVAARGAQGGVASTYDVAGGHRYELVWSASRAEVWRVRPGMTVAAMPALAFGLRSGAIAWSAGPVRRLSVLYVQTGSTDARLVECSGDETVWSAAVTIATGTVVALGSGPNGMLIAAVFDSGTWTAYRRVNASASWTTLGTISTGALEKPCGLTYDWGPVRQWAFTYVNSGGQVQHKLSTDDGETWRDA